MNASAEIGFELKTILLPVTSISTKTDVTPEIRKSKKYRQIATSIEHVGLIEPLVVAPLSDGMFLLLDGALRFDIFKQRQDAEVRCILSIDDEGYTYNKRVSHLSNIGEHYMILKALSNGVSEQMISVSLNVDVETIRRKRSLLDGVCPEAIQLLTDRRVSSHAYGVLRKMKPLGQIQAAERMIHANNYSATMAKTLLTITKPELMLSPEKLMRASPGATAKLLLLQEESDNLLSDVKRVEGEYATQALDLTLSLGYIEHLLANSRIEKYLAKHHPDILNEFRKVVAEKADEMSRPVAESVPSPPQKVRPPQQVTPSQKVVRLQKRRTARKQAKPR